MRNFSSKSGILIAVILAIMTVSPLVTLAIDLGPGQGAAGQPYSLLAPLPCIPTPARIEDGQNIPAVVCPGGELQNVSTTTFQSYIQFAFNLAIAAAAVAAVLMMVFGGL